MTKYIYKDAVLGLPSVLVFSYIEHLLVVYNFCLVVVLQLKPFPVIWQQFALVTTNNLEHKFLYLLIYVLQKQLLETKEAIERQRKLFKKKQSGNSRFPFLF